MNLAIPVDLIELGCSVYALSADDTDADMRQVKGGVVVAIATGTSRTTGEIQRKFITATTWQRRIRFDEILADDVRQADPPNTASIRSLIRTAAGVVHACDKKTKPPFGSDEARCIQLQHDLMEALAS